MKIGIVTDSTADIPVWLLEEHQIQVVPVIIVLDGKEYVDGITITREEFYNRLPTLKTSPTTAAPSIGDFAASYETLLSQGCEHVVSIHIAGTLTTMLNVARQAAKEFGGKVTCVDSGSLSLGIGFQVLAAAETAEFGLQAVLDAIQSTRKRLQVTAALDTMEYLRRGGRVPAVVARLGGALSIKPVVELIEGVVKPLGAVRTTRQADERMLDLLLQQGELQRLAVMHTNAERRARLLLDGAMARNPRAMPREILFSNVTAVIGAHLGPNAVGFAAVRK
ncbi:MAG: DegV family protein [Chloroflexi bacterium]|nr:DegV family protein [Chloroflexota bacterium]